MMLSIWINASCTHHFLSAPVHSCSGTTQSCHWTSLPTSPPPPVWAHWWCHPWRKTIRPHWSAGRESELWPAAGHTHCPLTCPGEKSSAWKYEAVHNVLSGYLKTDQSSNGQRGALYRSWTRFYVSASSQCLFTVFICESCYCRCHGYSPSCGTGAVTV